MNRMPLKNVERWTKCLSVSLKGEQTVSLKIERGTKMPLQKLERLSKCLSKS